MKRSSFALVLALEVGADDFARIRRCRTFKLHTIKKRRCVCYMLLAPCPELIMIGDDAHFSRWPQHPAELPK